MSHLIPTQPQSRGHGQGRTPGIRTPRWLPFPVSTSEHGRRRRGGEARQEARGGQSGSCRWLWSATLVASLSVAPLVKNPPAMRETWVRFLGWKIPRRRERLPSPVFWPGELHGLYSPRSPRAGHHFHFPFSITDIQGTNSN